ncbi:MAG: T9SS type A sorting domain-containing protein [Candidatus Cloacimonadales bacterium]|nr:T9SS type A sorting domain-containing protein [Candidatus Cloacimonadales bacterium]
MKRLIFFAVLLFGTALFSQTPSYEFITEPIDLIENYYDYMPGSYNALPIQIEDDGSLYIVFHGRETAASTRRVYYCYIDTDGNVTDIATISTYDIHEGFAGIDLDPITHDPLVAWHGNYDITSADMEVVFNYDRIHLGSPGLWLSPFVVFDDNTPSPNMPDDCFIWPEVHIGPSPIPDKRRAYVIGKNSAECPLNGNPSENILIGYADFDEEDLNGTTNFNWTYRTIELLDEWHNGNPEWVRPYLSCTVSDDGQIAFIGHIAFGNQSVNFTDQLIVLHNDNFGVGEFEYHYQEAHYNVWYPTANDWYFAPYRCQNKNVIFTDNKVSFLGAMSLLIEPGVWYPDIPAVYPKIFSFDVTNNEFSFYDLYLEGANPADDMPMIPWDLNEDGVVDSVNANGEPIWPEGWPFYNVDYSNAFSENLFKITRNEENGWLAAVWSDGLKALYAEEGVPGYEDWLEKPEIAICISADNGESWSQPIFLNALETPELEGMIPEYVYPGDKIEDLGDDHGKLHLFFLDDYEYGSNFTGGMQKYCSLDIDFGDFTESPEITVPTAQLELTNYPNPFNPSTTISFETMTLHESAQIQIYNLKGQKVKSFSNLQITQSTNHQIVWDGTDANNKPVSSGVYFAKLIDGDQIATRKMLLMK